MSPAQRLLNTLITAMLTVALALLFTTAHLLDDPGLTPAQHDAIAHLKAEKARERAASALCVSEHGPQTAHHWDADGTLVCITRRGHTQTASLR